METQSFSRWDGIPSCLAILLLFLTGCLGSESSDSPLELPPSSTASDSSTPESSPTAAPDLSPDPSSSPEASPTSLPGDTPTPDGVASPTPEGSLEPTTAGIETPTVAPEVTASPTYDPGDDDSSNEVNTPDPGDDDSSSEVNTPDPGDDDSSSEVDSPEPGDDDTGEVTLGPDDDDSPDPTPTTTPVPDSDQDGFPSDEDCDDSNPDIHPGAAEVCNGVDNDCDGEADEGVRQVYYADADGDGFGRGASTTLACTAPDGYSEAGGDCDDESATVYPGAPELCDHQDNDCDQLEDDGFDSDNDGYSQCDLPEADCDDTRDDVYPGAEERCDGSDQNCDGNVDGEYQTSLGLAISVLAGAESEGADGTTAAPFPTIEEGMAATGSRCKTVAVGAGIYPENVDYSGRCVALISTDGAEATLIDGGGLDSVVKFVSGEGPCAELVGFTLSSGSATQGGGVLCIGSKPTLEQNVIENNVAVHGGGLALLDCALHLHDNLIQANLAQDVGLSDGKGGGIFVEGGEPLLEDNALLSNQAYFYGGGLAITGGSTAIVRGGEIKGNYAGDYLYSRGGGIYSDGSAPAIAGVEVGGNVANGEGGGITMRGCSGSGALCSIEDSEITANICVSGKGGGVHISGGSAVIVTRSLISRNYGAFGAGGLYAYYSDIEISNNLIHCNDGEESGGGIFLDSSYPDILNNTIVENIASDKGGGLYFYDNQSTDNGIKFVNNLVYNNDGDGLYHEGGVSQYWLGYNNAFNNKHGDYENLEDPTGTNGNISIKPKFNQYFDDCDETTDDYVPALDGGMVDLGTDTALGLDIRGVSRPRDGDQNGIATYDIGAYER